MFLDFLSKREKARLLHGFSLTSTIKEGYISSFQNFQGIEYGDQARRTVVASTKPRPET
jgi:hypothetical protein